MPFLRRLVALVLALPLAFGYSLNFDTTPDYLGLGARVLPAPQDNYYFVLGDWGGEGIGCGAPARAVAQRMKAYVRAQLPRRLLFVANVGDSFYWTGLGDDLAGLRAWRRLYGDADPASDLTAVPWFSVMGNHDYGSTDAGALCSPAPRFVCTPALRGAGHPGCGARPYTTDNSTTGYQGNQLDAAKQAAPGPRAAYGAFVMPDFAYYYRLPALDLELVALDVTFSQDLNGIGGDARGAAGTVRACGGQRNLAARLQAIEAASRRLLLERAASPHANILLLQHYPGAGPSLRTQLLAANASKAVLSAWGHVHNQGCGQRVRGECVGILSGGGGGCCPQRCNDGTPNGFAVVSFVGSPPRQRVECLAQPACTVEPTCSKK